MYGRLRNKAIAACAVACALVCNALHDAAFATPDINAAYVITAKTSKRTYSITELLEHKREKINPLNLLRFRRGDEYYLFEDAQTGYPIRLAASEINVKDFAGVLDRRSFAQRHPNYDLIWRVGQTGFSIWSCF